jgi:hypothetical protein
MLPDWLAFGTVLLQAPILGRAGVAKIGSKSQQHFGKPLFPARARRKLEPGLGRNGRLNSAGRGPGNGGRKQGRELIRW